MKPGGKKQKKSWYIRKLMANDAQSRPRLQGEIIFLPANALIRTSGFYPSTIESINAE
jgi:hypothetical protein